MLKAELCVGGNAIMLVSQAKKDKKEVINIEKLLKNRKAGESDIIEEILKCGRGLFIEASYYCFLTKREMQ